MNESAFNDPRLTKDGEGYVYWKGRHVEHYSFERSEEGRMREEEAARDLIQCCEFLESIGVVPTSRTAIWFSGWFEGLTLDHPYYYFIRATPNLYEHPEGKLLLWEKKGRYYVWDGEIGTVYRYEQPRPKPGDVDYHFLIGEGWKSADVGQSKHAGPCYGKTEEVTALLRRYNVPAGLRAEQ